MGFCPQLGGVGPCPAQCIWQGNGFAADQTNAMLAVGGTSCISLVSVAAADENSLTPLHRLLPTETASLGFGGSPVGGGYVIVTLMKKKFVDDYHWIEENEMLDLVAIAQSAPGPIAVNGAIVVGYKLAGLAGTLVAIIGTIIPPFVIISLISAFYHAFRDNYLVSQMLEGMQAGVGAVIASVTYEMGCGIIKKKDNVATIVMIAAFIAACVLGINVIYIVIASGVFGVIRTIWNRRRKRV